MLIPTLHEEVRRVVSLRQSALVGIGTIALSHLRHGP
jgi:hypothetical protein